MAEESNITPVKGKERNPYKIIMIVLSVVAVAMIGLFIWVWIDRNALIDDLTMEKYQLTSQMEQLRDEYSVLVVDNDSLNVQLVREKEKVEQLIDRVKKTEATNRARIREYEKELGTLRSIMKNYIVQIDSLNTLNIALREDAAKARKDVETERAKSRALQSTADRYAKQVELGSIIKGRGLNMVAINSSNKETDRSSRTDKLKACVSLVENSIATKGLKTVFIRIKGPDGVLLTQDEQQFAEIEGELMIISASRQVDYQGEDIETCIYFSNDKGFTKGVYTVDAYTSEGKLGSADMLLR